MSGCLTLWERSHFSASRHLTYLDLQIPHSYQLSETFTTIIIIWKVKITVSTHTKVYIVLYKIRVFCIYIQRLTGFFAIFRLLSCRIGSAANIAFMPLFRKVRDHSPISRISRIVKINGFFLKWRTLTEIYIVVYTYPPAEEVKDNGSRWIFSDSSAAWSDSYFDWQKSHW